MYGFDVYYKDSLNKAHLLARKAEQFLDNEQYEVAIDYHYEAAKLLEDVILKVEPIVLHKNAILSLQLQLEHHQKQEQIILLRKRQNDLRKELENKNRLQTSMRTSQEAFQNVSTYSSVSIESYDSTDYTSSSAYDNGTNSNNEQLIKRDDVIKKMGMLIRQQQNEILELSNKLKEKDEANILLYERIRMLEEELNERN